MTTSWVSMVMPFFAASANIDSILLPVFFRAPSTFVSVASFVGPSKLSWTICKPGSAPWLNCDVRTFIHLLTSGAVAPEGRGVDSIVGGLALALFGGGAV